MFRDLATAHVRVIDVSTGMASNSAGARIQFGALALVNDTMLQIVRSETLRGLEGRALAGFWAGGRVYGYKTVREENPPEPEHPRAIPVVDEVQAAIVRRIFQLYADNHGLKQIASLLNEDACPRRTTMRTGSRAVEAGDPARSASCSRTSGTTVASSGRNGPG